MISNDDNPTITPFLRNFTLVETLVLVFVGFGLFLFPKAILTIWPWQIAPFNTRFLGAIYLGAMVPVGFMFLLGRWSPTRPVLRAIFTFTLIVLIVSLFTSSQFDLKFMPTWAWFALYISLPISAGYHLWLYRSMPTTHLNPVPGNWKLILQSTSLIVCLYGFGLIVLPGTFSSLFPWKLDVFHSQLYSATFITGGVMMLTISKRATSAEFIATGLTEATFGVFAILGLFIVDADVHKINWSASNTLLWLGSISILAILGIALIVAGARQIPQKRN